MAHYRLCYKKGKVSYGRGHAGYILREGGYEAKEDLVYKESGNMEWMTNGSSALDFWDAADENERVNGNAYREFELAIPNQLAHKESIELIKKFVEKEIGKTHPYTFAIHESSGKNGQKNLHCHLMFSERAIDGITRDVTQFFKRNNPKNPEKGGAKKVELWSKKERLLELRKSWEVEVNKSLEKSGLEERVDCRSLKAQRQEALDKGDLDKAEMFNRQPINIEGKILQQQKRLGVDSLTEVQKIKLEKHEETKKIKTKKEKEYEVKKGLRVPTEQECVAKLKELDRNNNLQERALNMCSRGEFLRTQKEINHLDTLILISPEAQGLRKDKEELEKKIEELKLITTTNQYSIVLRGLEKDYEKEKLVYGEAYKSYGKSFESEKKAIEESKEEKTLEKITSKYSKSEDLFKEKERLLQIDPLEKARDILTEYQLTGRVVNAATMQKEKEALEKEYDRATLFDKKNMDSLKEKIDFKNKDIEKNFEKIDLLYKELDKQSEKVNLLAGKISKDIDIELKVIDSLIQGKENTTEMKVKLFVDNEKQKKLYSYYSENNLDGKYNKQLFETKSRITVADKLLSGYEKDLQNNSELLKDMKKNSKENLEKIRKKTEKYLKATHKIKGIDQNEKKYLAMNIISKGVTGKTSLEIGKLDKDLKAKEREFSQLGALSFLKKSSLSKEIDEMATKKESLVKRNQELYTKIENSGKLEITIDGIERNFEKAIGKIKEKYQKEKNEEKRELGTLSIIRSITEKGEHEKCQPVQQQQSLGIMRTINQLKNALAPSKNNGQNNLGVKLEKEKENEGWEL